MNFGSNNVPPHAPRPEIDLGQFARSQNFGDDDEGGGIDWRRYVSALLRHKWIVVGLTLLGIVAGAAISTFAKPIFEARAAVQLPAPGRFQNNPGASAPLVDGLGWVELVRSFQVLDDVVRKWKSYLEYPNRADSTLFANFDLSSEYLPDQYVLTTLPDGRLQLSSRTVAMVDVAALGDSLGRPMGFHWVPPAAPTRAVEFRVRSLRDASVELDVNLQSPLSRDGSALRLSLTGTDPVRVAAILNDIVNRFISVATRLKSDKLTTVTRVLGEQLESARSDLTAAETELQRFKVQTITLPDQGAVTSAAAGLADTDPARSAFFRLRVDKDALTRDRDAIARAIAANADTSRSIAVSLGIIGSVQSSRELSSELLSVTDKRARLQQLRVAFAPGHPQVRSLESEITTLERQTIPSQARALMSELDQQIRDLDGRIAASSVEMQQIPVRFTEEARRERNVQVAQMIYTQLQSAYEQARLAELSAAPDLRLLDPAVPPTTAASDQVTKVLLGGLLGGILLGVVVAILLDLFDSRIRYPDQVTRELGLQILGALPMLGKGRDGAPNRDDVSALLEATRAIRMALLYAHGTAGPFITTVSSPGPGDGKSFTSANIAKAFAASGRRTLLIDADNRRGVLHRAFGVERKPGLMELLQGKSRMEDVIHEIADAGLDFLPTGTRLAAAPEMLASPAMQQLLAECRTRYQAVIIDSPPLGAGVDPLLLASLTGTLVIVLRNGVTDRAFAGARLDSLQRLPIRILGAVLNDVRASEGMYRYYTYIPGYRSEDEIASEDDVHRRLIGGGKKT
jgi:tyrosine-protein kinase Etk/Wzc